MQSKTTRVCLYGLGLMTLVASTALPALATTNNVVPEIDGSSIPAALGILSAGILMLRARRQSK